MPPDRYRNARDSFLRLEADERLLFFYDWSYWQNAKTGLAITTQSVTWKCVWEDPVSVDLRKIAPDAVTVEKTVLVLAGEKIDMDDGNDFDEALANDLAQAICELALVLAAAG